MSTKDERAASLGRFMKRASEARELSPQQLAWLLGRSRSHPYQVFAGRTGLRLATAAEWSCVLGVDIGLLACAYAHPAGSLHMRIPAGRALEEPLSALKVHPGAFGDAVRQIRLRCRLRQTDLAARAGVGCRHLRRMEAGSVRAPELETAYRLGAAMARSDGGLSDSDRHDRRLGVVAVLARAYSGALADRDAAVLPRTGMAAAGRS